MQTNFYKDRNEGFAFFDLHVHSVFSDGASGIEDLARRSKRLGIGFAVTDHNTVEGVEAASDLGYEVVPGIEATSNEGLHVLCYFPTLRRLKAFFARLEKAAERRNNSVLTISKLAKSHNGIAAIAHPFRTPFLLRLLRHYAIKLRSIGSIEIFNGLDSASTNANARNLASYLRLSSVAGSDAHIIQHVGKVLTAARAYSIKDLLKEIKAGRTKIISWLPKKLSFICYPFQKIFNEFTTFLKNRF